MALYKYSPLYLLFLTIILIPIINKQYNSKSIKSLSLSMFILALPFWIWALYHNINGYTDLGLISFGTVIISYLKCNGYLGKIPENKLCKQLLAFTSFLVILNYSMAIYITKKINYYYIIATIVWTYGLFMIMETISST